jgi:hypothetical protein
MYVDDIGLRINKAEELQKAIKNWNNQLAVRDMRMSKAKRQ